MLVSSAVPDFCVLRERDSARVSCARGDIENRIKELHDGLQIGRTSCCRFWVNQLRVLLTAAAYVLINHRAAVTIVSGAGIAC
jgi:hypothetical protein